MLICFSILQFFNSVPILYSVLICFLINLLISYTQLNSFIILKMFPLILLLCPFVKQKCFWSQLHPAINRCTSSRTEILAHELASYAYPLCTLLCAPATPNVYPMCTPCVSHVFTMCTPCVPHVYPMCTPCIPQVYTVLRPGSYAVSSHCELML